MDGRLFLVELIATDEMNSDRAFIVVPEGESITIHVERAAKALVEEPIVVTPDCRVLNVEGEVIGIVSFKEVRVPGWTITAQRDPYRGNQRPPLWGTRGRERCGNRDRRERGTQSGA